VLATLNTQEPEDNDRWVASHHGTASLQVINGGGGLQICREAASIVNKQSRTSNKGCYYELRVGRGVVNSSQ
jgi:hypothetical protein